MDEYEIVALGKRLGFTLNDMKEMSFVTYANCLLSAVEDDEKQATQEDINKFFGQEVKMETSSINVLIVCLTLIVIFLISKWHKKS